MLMQKPFTLQIVSHLVGSASISTHINLNRHLCRSRLEDWCTTPSQLNKIMIKRSPYQNIQVTGLGWPSRPKPVTQTSRGTTCLRQHMSNTDRQGKQSVQAGNLSILSKIEVPRVQQVLRDWVRAQAHLQPKLEPKPRPDPWDNQT